MKVSKAKNVDNTHVFQHNHLIRTPLRMGLLEARIFVYALAHVHTASTTLPPIKIPLSAVVGDNPNGDDYADAKAACKALVRQILNVLPPNSRRGNLREVPLMAAIDLDLGTGMITGTFNTLTKPYLLQLKETGNFTSANIETLLTFTNPNSARLYWILQSYRNLDSPQQAVKVQLALDDLKAWILRDTALYPVFAEFKRNVLDKVAADFKRIAYGATWEPIKTGKKITGLEFSIPKDKAQRKVKELGTVATDSDFPAWLASTADRKLQAAYRGLLDKNQLAESLARRIIRYVASNPDKHPSFYTTRHRIATHKQPIASMASFSLAALNAALATEFK